MRRGTSARKAGIRTAWYAPSEGVFPFGGFFIYNRYVGFTVRQEKFEGPLELLLDLIEKEELAISEISLALVTDEYLAHVRSLPSPDPEELAEFLVVAVQLMLIKSRSLLPGLEASEEEQASAEELEARLKELQRIRGAAKSIQELERKGFASRSRDAYLGMEPVFHPPPALTRHALADAFAALIAVLPKAEKLAEEKLKRIVSLEEKIAHVRSILQGAIERGFSEIVQGAKEKVEIVVSFLALLELAKQKFVELRQDKPFTEIFIKWRSQSRN